MEGLGWFAAIIVGGLAGWIASSVMKTGTGIIANIILGHRRRSGAQRDPLRHDRYTYYGWIGQLIVGAVGAIILIFLYRVVTSRNP